jgi:hypothetical protein
MQVKIFHTIQQLNNVPPRPSNSGMDWMEFGQQGGDMEADLVNGVARESGG